MHNPFAFILDNLKSQLPSQNITPPNDLYFWIPQDLMTFTLDNSRSLSFNISSLNDLHLLTSQEQLNFNLEYLIKYQNHTDSWNQNSNSTAYNLQSYLMYVQSEYIWCMYSLSPFWMQIFTWKKRCNCLVQWLYVTGTCVQNCLDLKL